MQTLVENCNCIFFHPLNPERRAELQSFIDHCHANPGGTWDVYQYIRTLKALGPCETRGE
jgi:hypothetical protein